MAQNNQSQATPPRKESALWTFKILCFIFWILSIEWVILYAAAEQNHQDWNSLNAEWPNTLKQAPIFTITHNNWRPVSVDIRKVRQGIDPDFKMAARSVENYTGWGIPNFFILKDAVVMGQYIRSGEPSPIVTYTAYVPLAERFDLRKISQGKDPDYEDVRKFIEESREYQTYPGEYRLLWLAYSKGNRARFIGPRTEAQAHSLELKPWPPNNYWPWITAIAFVLAIAGSIFYMPKIYRFI